MDTSSKSLSSRESLYSVESTTSDEEDEERRCSDLDVFLSDSGSDIEKEAVRQRDMYSERRGFLFSPKLGRTNPGLLCRDRKRRMRKPLGLLASARLRPTGPCCQYPVALDKAYCDCLMDTAGGQPNKAVSQKRTESGGRKRQSGDVGGGQPHKNPVEPFLHGIKRQRSKEKEDQEDLSSPCWTERDHLFAQKCWELQGFIHPLRGLLSRLKTGRFDRGLSSFQQSVAMDRIQRIIGVLQKPEMGERYLGTLLQVEKMLKLWFPHITLKGTCTDSNLAKPAGNSEQSPVEESLTETRNSSSRDSVQSPPTEKLHQTHLTDPALLANKPSSPWGESSHLLGDCPAMNLTWIHTSPISNPPLGHVDLSQTNPPVFEQALLGPNPSPYGVIIFFQNNPATLGAFGRSASGTSLHVPPTCCHPSSSQSASQELPRCQSLPCCAPVVRSQLPRETLGYLSRSLPRLPTSSGENKEQRTTDSGRLAPYCFNS